MTDDPLPSLRERQRTQTRETIFQGVIAVLDAGELTDLSFISIARAARISERTIYRHFADLDALLDEFWPWFVQQLGIPGYSSTAVDLKTNPPRVFAVFDRFPGLIRALIASKVGRAARDRGNAQRQAAMNAAIADTVGGEIPAEDALALGAAVYAIYSGYGWASMRDFWKVEGAPAGRVAVEAVQWLLEGYKADRARRMGAAASADRGMKQEPGENDHAGGRRRR